VAGLSWSPDSNQLAIAGDEDQLLTWNFETGDVNRTGDAKDVIAVRWSPEPGRLLATTGHSSGHVQLWRSDDLTSDRVMKQNAAGAGGPGTDLQWIDKQTLAQTSGSYLHFWDLKSGETIHEPLYCPDGAPTRVLGFPAGQTPDAQRGVFGCEDGRLFGWEQVDGRFRQELLAPPAGYAVVPPAISPDGKRVAVASQAGVSVVNVDAVRAERAPSVDRQSVVSSLAWSRDSNRLAIGAADHWLQVFDTESGETTELPGISGAGSLAWSPDDSMLAAGSLRLISSGGTLRPTRVWRFQEPGSMSSSLFDQLGPTAIGTWSPQGDLLALATGKTMTVCDTAGHPVLSYEFESRPIRMAWMKKPGGHELLAVAFSDGPVQVFDTGQEPGPKVFEQSLELPHDTPVAQLIWLNWQFLVAASPGKLTRWAVSLDRNRRPALAETDTISLEDPGTPLFLSETGLVLTKRKSGQLAVWKDVRLTGGKLPTLTLDKATELPVSMPDSPETVRWFPATFGESPPE
jgi:WD40 repeat protein